MQLTPLPSWTKTCRQAALTSTDLTENLTFQRACNVCATPIWFRAWLTGPAG